MHIQYLSHLQAKLVKYRDEALEGGELVEQLTAQARSDHQTIKDLQGKLEEGQQQLTTIKVFFHFIVTLISRLAVKIFICPEALDQYFFCSPNFGIPFPIFLDDLLDIYALMCLLNAQN